ncbi:hypothetical protein GQ42DRAFT_2232 [Ramicandelaber brevisporus]|nr:hypothetical protein GQ42DRAFT_2232 [Ramicandelaber brevisporus]
MTPIDMPPSGLPPLVHRRIAVAALYLSPLWHSKYVRRILGCAFNHSTAATTARACQSRVLSAAATLPFVAFCCIFLLICHCFITALLLLCRYFITALLLPCLCLIAILLPSGCRSAAILLPICYFNAHQRFTSCSLPGIVAICSLLTAHGTHLHSAASHLFGSGHHC